LFGVKLHLEFYGTIFGITDFLVFVNGNIVNILT